MEFDRQARPARDPTAASRPEPPQRVAEANPPVLGDWFIYLSVVVLVCGVVAISALNFGAPLTSGFVRFPALVAAGLLIVLSADAAVRVWRSAWAWLPVDRGRGVFRLVWAGVIGASLLASVGAVVFLVNA